MRVSGRDGWLAGISLAAVVALGISGASRRWAILSIPVHSLADGFAQDLDPAASIFAAGAFSTL